MQIYRQDGDIINVTASRAVESGELYVEGALVGYTQTAAEEDQLVAIVTRGVFEVPVVTDTDIALGSVIYLSDDALTTDADDGAEPAVKNARAGIAVRAGEAVEGVAVIHLKLNA